MTVENLALNDMQLGDESVIHKHNEQNKHKKACLRGGGHCAHSYHLKHFLRGRFDAGPILQ